MKIVVAPDSYKGSLTAVQACAAMRDGARRAGWDGEIVEIPMADGGEGTTEALVAATGGLMREVAATGPLGERVVGRIGLLGDGKTAVLEMACVSGLPLVPAEERNPLNTTTYGTGELILAALDAGAKRIIVGIGGSATTDLGCGMAQALGVKFLDRYGRRINQPMTGGLLGGLSGVDVSGLDGRLSGVRIEAACDVSNPLLGENGSAAVYGPQKGATAEIVLELEKNLGHAVDLVERAAGRAVRDAVGAGAAGGLGAGLMAFAGAELKGGIELVLSACGFAEKVGGAALVLTGEGQIDGQTAFGKTISGVVRCAHAAGAASVAVVGSIGPGAERMYELGMTSMMSLVPGPMSLAEAMAGGESLLRDSTERAVRLWLAGKRQI